MIENPERQRTGERTEPVDGVDGALENGQEGIGDPVGQPVGVIGLIGSEEGLERVVAGNDEAGKVDKELASDVEEDEEEIKGTEAENDVDLGDRALLLKVVEGRVLGELRAAASATFGGTCEARSSWTNLLVELRNVLLGAFLERHFCNGVNGLQQG